MEIHISLSSVDVKITFINVSSIKSILNSWIKPNGHNMLLSLLYIARFNLIFCLEFFSYVFKSDLFSFLNNPFQFIGSRLS